MAEDVTTAVDTQTQPADTQTEVKPEEAQQTQQAQDPQQEGQPAVENSNGEAGDKEQTPAEGSKEPTQEELKAKLREYELRDEEERLIKEKLGLDDTDSQSYRYRNIDEQIVNEGKTAYLRLCTAYGVDGDPSKIDESISQLKTTDPAKAYEFQRQLEQLTNDVNGRRQYVQQQTNSYEISKFANEYQTLLNASPAFNNIMSEYVNAYGGTTRGIYNQLQEMAKYVMPVMKECFEAGKVYALSDKAKNDTTQVQGGVATMTSTPYNAGTTFTREQIRSMSPSEFAKYEAVITQQMREGKIQ